MELSSRTKRIIVWREYFEALPDYAFLDIMRMYLGSIKTPYNKQNLIESLSSFLRRKEIKENIVSLLCPADVKIIAAIRLMKEPTEECLREFFSGDKIALSLNERLCNLKDRLVLYTTVRNEKTVFDTNPLLDDELFSVTGPERLFKTGETLSSEARRFPFPTDSLVASFVNYVFSHPDCCKNDGTFKRKTLNDFMFLYSSGEQRGLQVLCNAFVVLGIFTQSEKSVEINWDRLKQFASLPSSFRLSYICAAGSGYASYMELPQLAKNILSVLLSVPKSGLTENSLVQLAFLAQEKNGGARSQGRFALMLKNSGAQASVSSLRSCIASCIQIGLFELLGTNSEGEEVFGVAEEFSAKEEEGQPVVELDAAGTVTVLSGASLLSLIPFIQFVSLVQFDVASSYQLDRHSAFRAFSLGQTDKTIFELLSKCCRYPVPQSVAVSLEEWYSSFNSVAIYKGYVVKVSDKMRAVFLNSPEIKKHVVQELSESVFVLDFASDEEASLALETAGLAERKIRQFAGERQRQLSFPLLRDVEKLFDTWDNTKTVDTLPRQQELLDFLLKKLSTAELSADQKEVLEERINLRVIVSDAQLDPDYVRFERREAEGMDYSGKMHIIDTAISERDMVEVTMEENVPPVKGTPLEVTDKKTSEAKLVIMLESERKLEIPVGAIRKIKRVRQPLDFN